MPQRSLLWPDLRSKPPFGSVEVDRTHPLALGLVSYWLFTEGAGFPVDLVSPAAVTTASATQPSWASSARGVVLSWSADGAITSPQSPSEAAAGPISCFGFVNPAVNPGHPRQILARNFNTGWRCRLSGASPSTLQLLDRGGTNTLTSTGTLTDGIWTSVGLVMNASGLAIYFNGALDASNATAFGGGNSATLYIGLEDTAGTESWRGQMDAQAKWSRTVTAGEFLWLHAEPYAFLRPILRRRYFVPTAAPAAPIPRLLMPPMRAA